MAPTHTTESQTISLASPAMLRKIDKLRERGIGEHLDLPQLVVVGDQSSGKSSLLESLTGLPFERDVRLCTRYATQITSRRGAERRIDVSILPAPGATEAHKAHLARFRRSVPHDSNLGAEMHKIGAEAKVFMGIRPDKSKEGPAFSKDVLKIEILGPEEDYLTVIDVPGIFRKETKGVTTNEDKSLVQNMVESYMQDSRTIILAVLPCLVDIATQEVLSLAQKYDKSGERTIGVLTKPDLLTQQADKNAISDLVLGREHQLTLGYYIVCNRGADAEGSLDPKVRDLIFQEKPWAELPKDRLGVTALRSFLGVLLAQIARQEFPKLRKEANATLQNTQNDLRQLGTSRQTAHEQRLYLTSVVSQFQGLAQAAVSGQYSTHTSFEKVNNLRLITRLLDLADRFKTEFEQWSELRAFSDLQPAQAKTNEAHKLDTTDPEETMSNSEGSSWCQASMEGSNDSLRFLDLGKASNDFPDLAGIIDDDCEVERPMKGIMIWLRSLYMRFRGPELGTFGATILFSAFQEQSSKWSNMTRAYVSRSITRIHEFITTALEIACADEHVRNQVSGTILEDLLRRYRMAMDQAIELVSTERDHIPYTFNPSYYILVDSARQQREQSVNHSLDLGSVKSRKMLQRKFTEVVAPRGDNASHIKDHLYDNLYAYYSTSRDRFIDNLYRQIIFHQLLCGQRSPLNVLNHEWVIGLETDQLETIAGELPTRKARRITLEKKEADLIEALKILRT